MGRNGHEVTIHECPVLKTTIDFGLLPFGKIWVCRHCKEELNAALDSNILNDDVTVDIRRQNQNVSK